MAAYLIDTHIFLWWLNGDKKLEEAVHRVLENPRNKIYVSVASLWEISIKHSIGKLSLKTSLSTMISASGFEILQITSEHVLALDALPELHTDPFDRMLIAQAKIEHVIFITEDAKIKKYDIKLLVS